MPVVATAKLQPDCAEWQVKLIVEDGNMVDRDLVIRAQRSDRSTGEVHEAERFGESDLHPCQHACGHHGSGSVALESGTDLGRERIAARVTDVVTVALVLRSRIPEADYEPPVVSHLGLVLVPRRPAPEAGPGQSHWQLAQLGSAGDSAAAPASAASGLPSAGASAAPSAGASSSTSGRPSSASS